MTTWKVALSMPLSGLWVGVRTMSGEWWIVMNDELWIMNYECWMRASRSIRYSEKWDNGSKTFDKRSGIIWSQFSFSTPIWKSFQAEVLPPDKSGLASPAGDKEAFRFLLSLGVAGRRRISIRWVASINLLRWMYVRRILLSSSNSFIGVADKA